NQPEARKDAKNDADEDADEDATMEDVGPHKDGYTGTLKGFEYSLAYKTRSNGVTLTLEAANGEEGETKETEKEGKEEIVKKFKELKEEEKKEQLRIRNEAQKREMDAEEKAKKRADRAGVAKKLFEIAKDNLDVRFRAKVDMDNCAVTGFLDIKGGNIENAMAQFKQVHGTA